MTTRRTFIGAAGASGTLLAATAASAAAAPKFDFAAVSARFAAPAKHRQVFAIARIADGSALAQMAHGIDAYEITRGEGPGAMHAVGVFYGRGVVLGLSDAMWDQYRLAEYARRQGDIVLATGRGNAYGARVATLVKRGADFLVCNNAIDVLAEGLAAGGAAGDRSVDELRAQLRTSLVPGAFLVPAGVGALNEAQEAHFTFVQGSI